MSYLNVRKYIMQIDIGINETNRQEIAKGLSNVLADSYTLYLKTHKFHWNVTGPYFTSLHLMFEEHYTELATAVDEIAERIRALGVNAPGSYQEFAKLSSIKEEVGTPDYKEMIKQLVEGHEAIVRTARTTLLKANEASDEVTASLLADRMTVHEKTAWMLRSLVN